MKKKLIILIGIVFTCITILPPLSVAANETIENSELLNTVPAGMTYAEVFPDQRLAELVADAVTPTKTIDDMVAQADLNTITQLRAIGSNISDISGMEYLVNLETLYLSDNDIIDVSPLANLQKLTHLDLGFNEINDISPIKNLANYHPDIELLLDNNHIMDVSSLNNFTNIVKIGNQTVVSSQFILSMSYDTIIMPYKVVDFDGSLMTPSFIQPSGGQFGVDANGNGYISWKKDQFLASQSNNQVFLYATFGTINQNSFSVIYRLYADYTPPTLIVDSEISYETGNNVSDAQFLNDIHASTDAIATLETNVNSVVDWNVPGDYEVYVQAMNSSSNMHTEQNVVVHIIANDNSASNSNTTGDSSSANSILPETGQDTEVLLVAGTLVTLMAGCILIRKLR